MRFECQSGCVTCCQQKGSVYLTENDIVRAAVFLGMSAAEFEKRFVYRTTNAAPGSATRSFGSAVASSGSSE